MLSLQNIPNWTEPFCYLSHLGSDQKIHQTHHTGENGISQNHPGILDSYSCSSSPPLDGVLINEMGVCVLLVKSSFPGDSIEYAQKSFHSLQC